MTLANCNCTRVLPLFDVGLQFVVSFELFAWSLPLPFTLIHTVMVSGDPPTTKSGGEIDRSLGRCQIFTNFFFFLSNTFSDVDWATNHIKRTTQLVSWFDLGRRSLIAREYL